MILKWHEEAEAEFASAAVYYEDRVEDLGERFIHEVEVTLDRILVAPSRFRLFDGECRKASLARFPYFLIYRTNGNNAQIIALMHSSRRPGYWKHRLDR